MRKQKDWLATPETLVLEQHIIGFQDQQLVVILLLDVLEVRVVEHQPAPEQATSSTGAHRPVCQVGSPASLQKQGTCQESNRENP